MKRIVLTGAESTGKSTLAQALSCHYGEPCTDEFVRNYVDAHDRDLQIEDLTPIAEGQLALEDSALKAAQRLLIHDTNILSSIIYADHYFGTTLDWVNDAFGARHYDLYLLCMPDIPWTADPGQRESAAVRDQLHARFKDSLDHLKLPYIELHGSEAARLTKAVQSIEAILSNSHKSSKCRVAD